MVIPVHNPMVFSDSRACSTAPVLTSEAMSNIFNVASNQEWQWIFDQPNAPENDEVHHTRIQRTWMLQSQ